MPNESKRSNGTIELLRFVFSIAIVCTHVRAVSNFSYFGGGWFGVEFFFIISGVFMAQSAQKIIAKQDIDVPDETRKFILKKINQFLPHFLLLILLCFLLVYIPSGDITFNGILVELISIVPGILLTSMAGTTNLCSSIPGVTWYLSAMIIGLMILYPIYLKWNSLSRNIIFPLAAIFCTGYVAFTYGNLYYAWEINNLIRAGLIRAIGEMCLGVVAFDVSMYLRKIKITNVGKVISAIIGIFCIISIVCFIQEIIAPPHISMVYVMAILVVIVYSEICFKINSNKIITYLGKVSLCIYLFHMLIINALIVWVGADYVSNNGIEVYIIAITTSILMYLPIKIISEKSIMRKVMIKCEPED